MSLTIELSSAEQQAYKTITTADGLHQSELWKRLDISSRKGSRLAKSLAEYGLIERTQSTHNGRTTYLLTPSANVDGLQFSKSSQHLTQCLRFKGGILKTFVELLRTRITEITVYK